MKFQVMHVSRGMMRLKAAVRRMSLREADLLEASLKKVDGVGRVVVHERTLGVMIYGENGVLNMDAVRRALAAFSYAKAERETELISHNSRALNREYKEKILFHVIYRYARRLFLPLPLRRVYTLLRAVPYAFRALRCLLKGEITVDLLDGIAISVSLLTRDFSTAESVLFLLKLGDYLDCWTYKKSVEDLAKSMALHVEKVWLRTADGGDVLVPVSKIAVGDRVVVSSGSMIPLDGVVEEGDVTVNQSSLTGESAPAAKRVGGAVFAGSVVEEGRCVIRVTERYGENKYDRIVRMIEDSEKLKSDAENRAGHLADRLVPWSLGGSALTYLLTRDVTKAVSVLMVDFSCALKLSMPLSVLSAMGEAGRHRITVKGGKYLEKIAQGKTIIFDKTGTLTRACPTVAEVIPFNGQDEREMLRVAACLEEHFPHSMANAVVRAAKERGIDHEEMHSEVDYIVAHGIASDINGEKVIIGSYHFVFEDEGVSVADTDRERFAALPDHFSLLYLAIGGVLSAVICVADPLRPEAKAVIAALKTAGFEKTVMLTGDSAHTAKVIAGEVGVDDFRGEVLPEDKAAYIRSEQAAGRTVVMIGDGINDAPALSYADVSVAVGTGAAIAREVADITISAEDLYELVLLKELADGLMRRIRGNYRFVMTFNGALIFFGALGILPPALSALLHNSSTLLLSLGSMTKLLKR